MTALPGSDAPASPATGPDDARAAHTGPDGAPRLSCTGAHLGYLVLERRS